jgi:hypothetical protein
MRLIHEIPNIDSAIGFTYETHTRSTWTPTSTSVITALCDTAAEKRYLDIVLPNTEMEIIHS